MSTAKQDVQALLARLPDDCTYEDIQYHLYVMEKIRLAQEASRQQGTIPHEQIVAEFSEWLD